MEITTLIATHRKMIEKWKSIPDKSKISDEDLKWLIDNSVYGTFGEKNG